MTREEKVRLEQVILWLDAVLDRHLIGERQELENARKILQEMVEDKD